MNTKIKQKLNITKAILIGSLFATTLTSTAFAVGKQAGKNPPAVLSGTEDQVEANKPVINKEDNAALKESFNNKLEATMRLLLAVDKEKWMDEELRSELMDKIFKVLFPNEKELAALQERIDIKLKNKSSELNSSSDNTKDAVKGTELFTVPVNSESEKFKIFAQDADEDEMRRRKSKVSSLQKASRLQGAANEVSK